MFGKQHGHQEGDEVIGGTVQELYPQMLGSDYKLWFQGSTRKLSGCSLSVLLDKSAWVHIKVCPSPIL